MLSGDWFFAQQPKPGAQPMADSKLLSRCIIFAVGIKPRSQNNN